MNGFGLHHGLSVHGIFQLANRLNDNPFPVLTDLFLTGLQISASGRAAPTLVVHMAGIFLAHFPHFRHQFYRAAFEKCHMRETCFQAHPFQFFYINHGFLLKTVQENIIHL